MIFPYMRIRVLSGPENRTAEYDTYYRLSPVSIAAPVWVFYTAALYIATQSSRRIPIIYPENRLAPIWSCPHD